MKHISLFSGIGGFELASQWIGWKNIVSCEINPFGNRVLEYYWPEAYHHTDVKTLTYDIINAECTKRYGKGWRNDDLIITGGFPCQPYSQAGKRKGKEDERHLWPEMLRVIREVRPAWVVGENVFGLINWSGGLVFDEVQADLEAEGYEVQPYVLPACAVNAPHRRDRIWFVAHSRNTGTESLRSEWEDTIHGFGITSDTESIRGGERNGKGINHSGRETSEHISKGSEIRDRVETISSRGFITHANSLRRERRPSKATQRAQPVNQQLERHNELFRTKWKVFPTQPPICRGNDGLSSRLVGITVSKHRNESIKAYGNSIVPQVIYEIFKVIDLLNRKEAKVA